MATAGREDAGRVIVTRPAHDAAVWVDQLQVHGIKATPLPLIEIAAALGAADVLALQSARQNFATYAACMFVSGNAVEHFFSRFNDHLLPLDQVIRSQSAPENIAKKFSPPSLPPHMRFLAPGPGTAQALQIAGVPAHQIDSPPPDAGQFDSAALWAVVGSRDWRGARVLLVRGHTDDGPPAPDAAHDSAPDSQGNSPTSSLVDATPDARVHLPSESAAPRDWLLQKWQAAGGRVDVVNVYERRAPKLTAEQLQLAKAASGDGSVWLFSSSEAVANLVGNAALANADWTRARAIATHPRIVQTVQAAGWGTIAPSRPALLDILQAWRSIESNLL